MAAKTAVLRTGELIRLTDSVSAPHAPRPVDQVRTPVSTPGRAGSLNRCDTHAAPSEPSGPRLTAACAARLRRGVTIRASSPAWRKRSLATVARTPALNRRPWCSKPATPSAPEPASPWLAAMPADPMPSRPTRKSAASPADRTVLSASARASAVIASLSPRRHSAEPCRPS